MKRSATRALLLPVAALLLTTVCNMPRGLAPTSTPSPEPTDYLIPPTTKVLDTGLQAALETVLEDGTLVFSASTPLLQALEPGDVLVSDSAAAAPNGMLRKVRLVRTEGTKVLVETDDAELIEAVHAGHLSFERELRPEDIRTTWLAPGVTFLASRRALHARPHLLSLPAGQPNLSAQWLSYSVDTDFGTGGKVRVVGSASLEPKLETDLNISCNQKLFGACAEIPDLNFKARIGILENVSLAVTGDAASFNKRIELARHEFSAFTLWIGPVPVVFVPILSVYLQGDGSLTSTVDFAIGQKLTLAAGFSYNSDTGFKDLSEASFDFLHPSPSFNGQVDLRGVVGGEFKLLLYGVIGPYASLEAGPRFRASVTGLTSDPGVLWKAEGCIWLFVGIDSVKVIKLRYQKELYNACAGFGSGLNQPPGVSIQSPNPGTQVFQGERLKLRATVYDPDGQQLSCRWTSDPGGDPFPLTACESANVEFTSSGSRTLTLTATDPLGASANASVSVDVLPPPNILVSIDSPPDGGTVGPDESITLSASASGGQAPYKYRWSLAYPTDAAGSGGSPLPIGSGASLTWAPSNSISFAGCEVNGYGRLTVEVEDGNDFSGSRSIVIAIMRFC